MALLLAIVVLLFLLMAFVYQIITTPVTAVDAPTLVKSAAAPALPTTAQPYRQPQASAFPARGGGQLGDAAVPLTGPAPQTSRREASRGRSEGGAVRGVAALAIGGLAAGIIGGWLLYRPARGATACSHQAIQVCSQGFVVLTGSQLAGGAIALAGILAVVLAGLLAAR